jgi:hypothetical protein
LIFSQERGSGDILAVQTKQRVDTSVGEVLLDDVPPEQIGVEPDGCIEIRGTEIGPTKGPGGVLGEFGHSNLLMA